MRNVKIQLNKADFEYDVHSLTKAFYPEDEVKVYSPEDTALKNAAFQDGEAAPDVLIDLDYQEDKIGITCMESGNIFRRNLRSILIFILFTQKMHL